MTGWQRKRVDLLMLRRKISDLKKETGVAFVIKGRALYLDGALLYEAETYDGLFSYVMGYADGYIDGFSEAAQTQ